MSRHANKHGDLFGPFDSHHNAVFCFIFKCSSLKLSVFLCVFIRQHFFSLSKVQAHLCRNASPGFFGEVFRGIWNGTDVAIKVFLEQDLTTENMEDFCNEIYILRYLSHSWFTNVVNLLFFIICTSALIILLFLFSRLRHPNGKSSFWQMQTIVSNYNLGISVRDINCHMLGTGLLNELFYSVL